MITDATLQLSTAQPVTTSSVSTNTIPLGSGFITSTEPLHVAFAVDTSVTASGSATVAFQVISSASPDLSSPRVLNSTDAIGKAELTAGRRIIVVSASLVGLPAGHRYIGAQYVVATGPLLTGAFTAMAVDSDAAAALYPSGFSVA